MATESKNGMTLDIESEYFLALFQFSDSIALLFTLYEFHVVSFEAGRGARERRAVVRLRVERAECKANTFAMYFLKH